MARGQHRYSDRWQDNTSGWTMLLSGGSNIIAKAVRRHACRGWQDTGKKPRMGQGQSWPRNQGQMRICHEMRRTKRLPVSVGTTSNEQGQASWERAAVRARNETRSVASAVSRQPPFLGNSIDADKKRFAGVPKGRLSSYPAARNRFTHPVQEHPHCVTRF